MKHLTRALFYFPAMGSRCETKAKRTSSSTAFPSQLLLLLLSSFYPIYSFLFPQYSTRLTHPVLFVSPVPYSLPKSVLWWIFGTVLCSCLWPCCIGQGSSGWVGEYFMSMLPFWDMWHHTLTALSGKAHTLHTGWLAKRDLRLYHFSTLRRIFMRIEHSWWLLFW